jgi:hypothetical protein
MSYFERLTNFVIRRLIFGGIDILKKPPYNAAALVTLALSFLWGILLPSQALGISLMDTNLLISLSIGLLSALLATGLMSSKISERKCTSVFLVLFVCLSALIIFMSMVLLIPFNAVFQILGWIPLVFFYTWPIVLTLAIFSLVYQLSTGWGGILLGFGKPEKHFLYKGIVGFLVALSFIPVIVLTIHGMGIFHLFWPTSNILQLSLFTLDARFNFPGLSLIIGGLGLIAFVVTIISIRLGTTIPQNEAFAQITSYGYLYLLIPLLITLLPFTFDIGGTGISLLFTVVGVSSSVQAFAKQIQSSTRSPSGKDSVLTFTLLALAFSFILVTALVYGGIYAGILLGHIQLLTYISGVVILIVWSTVHLTQSQKRKSLTPKIESADVINKLGEILGREEVRSLLLQVGGNVLAKAQKSIGGIIGGVVSNLLKPPEESDSDEGSEK